MARFDLLCAFYHGPCRPRKYRWRNLARDLHRYLTLKRAGKVA